MCWMESWRNLYSRGLQTLVAHWPSASTCWTPLQSWELGYPQRKLLKVISVPPQSCCLPWPKLCGQCPRPRMIWVERDVSERRRVSQRRNRSSVKNIGPTSHIMRQTHISTSVSVGDPNLAIFNHFIPSMKSCIVQQPRPHSPCFLSAFSMNKSIPRISYELRWPCKVQLSLKGCTLLSLVLQLRNQNPSTSTSECMGRNMPNISKSLQQPGSVWPRWFVWPCRCQPLGKTAFNVSWQVLLAHRN